AREDADRLNAEQLLHDGVEFLSRDAERGGEGIEIAGEIAGLVELVDELRGDHAVAGLGQDEADLLEQVLAQRRLVGNGLWVVGQLVAVGAAAAAVPAAGETAGRLALSIPEIGGRSLAKAFRRLEARVAAEIERGRIGSFGARILLALGILAGAVVT